jgi:hypothetical protein
MTLSDAISLWPTPRTDSFRSRWSDWRNEKGLGPHGAGLADADGERRTQASIDHLLADQAAGEAGRSPTRRGADPRPRRASRPLPPRSRSSPSSPRSWSTPARPNSRRSGHRSALPNRRPAGAPPCAAEKHQALDRSRLEGAEVRGRIARAAGAAVGRRAGDRRHLSRLAMLSYRYLHSRPRPRPRPGCKLAPRVFA